MLPIYSDSVRLSHSALLSREPQVNAERSQDRLEEHPLAPSQESTDRQRGVRFAEPVSLPRRSLDSLLDAEDLDVAGLSELLDLEDWSESTIEARTTRLETLAAWSSQLPSCPAHFPSLAQALVVAAAGLTLTAQAGRDPQLFLFAGMSREALGQLRDAEVFEAHREELVVVLGRLRSAAPHAPIGICRALLEAEPIPEIWELWLSASSWASDLLQALHNALLWAEVEGSLSPGSWPRLEASSWARDGKIQPALHALLEWMRDASEAELAEHGHALYCELAQACLRAHQLEQALTWLAQAAPASQSTQNPPPMACLQMRDGGVFFAAESDGAESAVHGIPVVPSPAVEPAQLDHWRGLVRMALQAHFAGEMPSLQAAEKGLRAALLWQTICPAAAEMARDALAELPVEQVQSLCTAARLMVLTQAGTEPAVTCLLGQLAEALTPSLRQEWSQCRQVAARWSDEQASAMAGVLAELFAAGLEAEQHLFSVLDRGWRLRHLTGHEWEGLGQVDGQSERCVQRRWEAIDEALLGYIEWNSGGIETSHLKALQMLLVNTRQTAVAEMEARLPMRLLVSSFHALLTQLRAIGELIGGLPFALRQHWSPGFLGMGEAIGKWQERFEGWLESLRGLRRAPDELQARLLERLRYETLRRAAGKAVLRTRALISLIDAPHWPGTAHLAELAEGMCAWGRQLRQLRRSGLVADQLNASELLRAPDVTQIQACTQRVYLQIIARKRGLDGALCSLALVPGSRLQGGFGRIALGANSAQAVAPLWRQAVRLAVERKAWYTTQAMILRRLHGRSCWSMATMDLCRSECGPHIPSRGEPAQYIWPELGRDGRADVLNGWEEFWIGLTATQRSHNGRITGANDRTFALELLRQHTTLEERLEIYERHRRLLFGGSWLAPVLRTARTAGFEDLVDELEVVAQQMLLTVRPDQAQERPPASEPLYSTVGASVTALLPELVERFNREALSDP